MSVAQHAVTRRIRLSAAAINRYRICEKQFHLADVLRVKVDRSKPSPILAQANAVHHALERFYGIKAQLDMIAGVSVGSCHA